ncbi:MAG: tRNA pseudouridine(55) synthase TruB [Phycisphaerales bacterium]
MTPSPTGLLLIDKPRGPTSMDVCRVVKRALIAGGAPKKVKVGHGGTLDPLATGLLVVLIGRATRLCDSIMAGAKAYIADIDLSAFTPTDDAEGEREPVEVASPPTRAQIDAALPRFTGTIMQRPPVFSAMKVDGQRAYKLARKGREVELPPRPVRIDALRVLGYEWPRLSLHIDCGKGTYIRSLARDLGTALGTGGHLAGLCRTRIGQFTIEHARTLDALPAQLGQGDLLPVPTDPQGGAA